MQRTENIQKNDARLIPSEDKYRKIKYSLDDDPSNRTPYEQKLVAALWSDEINNPYARTLYGTSPYLPQPGYQTENKLKHIIRAKEIYSNHSLDIPADFYNNPLSWSKNGCIYIGADFDLFSYKFKSIEHICSFAKTEHSITSVTTSDAWILLSTFGNKNQKSRLRLIDPVTSKKFIIKAHEAKIGILRPETSNPYLFYAGNYLGELALIDLRNHNPIKYFNASSDMTEICGMSICNDMIATGSNGNYVHIWDKKKLDAPVWSHSNHLSAVKALAFSPFNHSMLGSAGGISDKTIQIWDISKQQLVTKAATESQTCNLHWMSSHTLFTTHGLAGDTCCGYSGNTPSAHKLKTWDMQSSKLKIVKSAQCFNQPILFSAQNPDYPFQFFTASYNSRLALVEVKKEVETNPGLFSIHNNRYIIR